MTNEFHFLGEVLAKLRAVKHSKIKQIGVASGVPESTVRKLYYGEVLNPRVQTVQALHDYFSQESSDKSLASTGIEREGKISTTDLTDATLPQKINTKSPTEKNIRSSGENTDVESK